MTELKETNEDVTEVPPERFGNPPYPTEYLVRCGGSPFIPDKSVPLHPCKRQDLCGGASCTFLGFPKDVCWDFARRGVCGRQQCRSAHIVMSTGGQLFKFACKKVKLNQSVSRAGASQLLAAKHARLESSRKREREVAAVNLSVLTASNAVDRARAQQTAYRSLAARAELSDELILQLMKSDTSTPK